MPRDVLRMTGDPGAWRNHRYAPAPGTELGPLAAIPDGEGREFAFGPEAEREDHGFSMFVVRRGEAAFGYVNVCPHFGLRLNHRRNLFTTYGEIMCSMHFALFRIDNGLCTDGACEGKSLDPVPIEITAAGTLRIAAP